MHSEHVRATQVGRAPAILATFVLLAACGGGGGNGNGEGDGTTPPPPTNRPPVATIVGPADAEAGDTVRLDGDGSSDPEGAPLTFSWTMAVPSGSTASIISPTSALASFRADVPGTYRAELVVSDGELNSAVAAHTLTVVPRPPVRATIRVPSAGSLVPDAVPVVVSVESTFEVSEVTAVLAGHEVTLTFDPKAWRCSLTSSCPGFVGTLTLAGQAIQSYTLVARATDVHGNIDDVSINVVHDNPPQVTGTAPIDLSVALPTVPLDLSCSDDLPGCSVEVLVNGELQQSAPSALNGTLDLGAWLGTAARVTLRARDSADQLTSEQRLVYVEDNARLATVAEVPGEILDADATRLLFVVPEVAGDSLAIYDRVTGLVENVPLPTGREVVKTSAFLTPTGAIFEAQESSSGVSRGTELTDRLYLWRLAALTELATPTVYHPRSLAVSGRYAIWSDITALPSALRRMNTSTGTVELVTTDANNNNNSVAANGTVAFGTTGAQIVLDVSGLQTTLTSDASHQHTFPLTDGTRVVYRRSSPCCADQHHAVVLIDGSTLIPLTPERDRSPEPGPDYQIAAGWTAFTTLGMQQQLHVFTRSPLGVVTQHTDLATHSYIDRLSGDGHVMVINGQKRYFSLGSGMVPVSSSAGRSYLLNGQWHVAIGRVLLSVDTG